MIACAARYLAVFHHISPRHADLYLNQISFRWSQRVVTTLADRRTRKGRETVRTLWSRILPALQLLTVSRARRWSRSLRRAHSQPVDLQEPTPESMENVPMLSSGKKFIF
jgi:hypothetical protein